jgi:hypothetical protein
MTSAVFFTSFWWKQLPMVETQSSWRLSEFSGDFWFSVPIGLPARQHRVSVRTFLMQQKFRLFVAMSFATLTPSAFAENTQSRPRGSQPNSEAPFKERAHCLFIGHSFFVPVARSFDSIASKNDFPSHRVETIIAGGRNEGNWLRNGGALAVRLAGSARKAGADFVSDHCS